MPGRTPSSRRRRRDNSFAKAGHGLTNDDLAAARDWLAELKPGIAGMKTTRLEAFSDGVPAIIITIMVLELKVPHALISRH
jgi:hypothetical protein